MEEIRLESSTILNARIGLIYAHFEVSLLPGTYFSNHALDFGLQVRRQ